MSTQFWNRVEVTNPRGLWSSVQTKRKGNPARATVAQNVRFSPGIVRCRPGTSTVLAVTGKVTEMFNWISPLGENLVLYYNSTDIRLLRQSDDSERALEAALTMYAPTFADLGNRVYFCGYDTDGDGTIQARVWDGTYTAGLFPDADICFRDPLVLDNTSAASDNGAGLCTIGTHLIGVIYQNRSGFAGKPTIATANGTALSVTLSSDAREISFAVSVDSTELTDANADAMMYVIMTRADNPYKWFFVPGAEYAVNPGTGVDFTHTFSISIADEDLAQADSADEYFNLLTQASNGTGPFNPSFVVPYGKRMVYGAGSKAYVSDIDDAQHITEDFHTISHPSRRKLSYAFPLANTQDLFLTGDKWTGRVTDSGDQPATWAQPAMISDSIGAPYPGCVCFRTAGPYAWVAAESGLYLFDGAYPEHPITFLCEDQWKRINWKAAYAIKVTDDPVELKCYVAAPLDTATSNSHIFVIDYTNGLRFDTCDISIDTFRGAVGTNRTLGAIAMVKEFDTGRSNLWIAPAAAGAIVRFDETTHNDVAWT